MPSSVIKQKIFEVSVDIPKTPRAALEVIQTILVKLGIPLQEVIEQEINGRRSLSFYCPTRKSAESFVSKLSKLKWRGLRVHSDILYRDDWLTRWKKDWKPFALTKQIDIVPVWCRKDYREGKRTFILLDTISSFGTGLHETTRFMAQFIEMLKGKFDSCLDIGTGTGILALVALKGGAPDVHAIDLDDMCIKAASANFKVNGYSNKNIKLKNIFDFTAKEQFDFVCANLVTHDLVEMKNQILACVRPQGWLAVSGISLENLPLLRRGFSNLPLRCVKIKKGTKWAAVLFKRHHE